jgi:hypothetical protein
MAAIKSKKQELAEMRLNWSDAQINPTSKPTIQIAHNLVQAAVPDWKPLPRPAIAPTVEKKSHKGIYPRVEIQRMAVGWVTMMGKTNLRCYHWVYDSAQDEEDPQCVFCDCPKDETTGQYTSWGGPLTKDHYRKIFFPSNSKNY